MGLKATFCKKNSVRFAGVPIAAFQIENTNWLRTETIDLAISDCYGQNTQYYRKIVLKSGYVYELSYDTGDWEVCQGDIVSLLDKDNRVVRQWQVNFPVYGPGECPECHGSHQCRHCRGEGFVYPQGRIENFQSCPACGGTGVCQTCYVPMRGHRLGGAPIGATPFRRR